jgi:hypothetical protein
MCYRHTRRRTKGITRQPAAMVFVAAALLACGRTVSAQGSPPALLSEGGGPEVRHPDEGPLRAAIRKETMRLAQGSAQVPKQGHSWIGRHPVILGTLVGAGVGAGFSQVEAIGGANHDPKVALIGAGAGAWGGLIASAVRKARTKETVGVGTKIGIVAGAVGVVVLPLLACYGAGGCGGSS